MQIRIECLENLTTVNIHNIKPKLADLSSYGEPLFVLRHESNTPSPKLAVFLDLPGLVAMRQQIDDFLALQKERLAATMASLPADINKESETQETAAV